MQAIKAYTQIYGDLNGQDILRKIERCGRVCYKSEDKIEEGSAEKFVANIIKRGHEAVLEHGSLCFMVTRWVYNDLMNSIKELEEHHDFHSFLRYSSMGYSRNIVSGNIRAWRDFIKVVYDVQGYLQGYLKYFIFDHPILFPEYQDKEIFSPLGSTNSMTLMKYDELTPKEKLIHQDLTVKFIVDRGVSHEIVRHRIASYCQESTRYCNYSKDKFGSEVTFIIPHYFDYGTEGFKIWKQVMKDCEKAYFQLLDWGCTPQEARAVLPNSLKTELVMTANLREWRMFFKLRTSQAAHPQIREVAVPLLEELKQIIPVVFDDL